MNHVNTDRCVNIRCPGVRLSLTWSVDFYDLSPPEQISMMRQTTAHSHHDTSDVCDRAEPILCSIIGQTLPSQPLSNFLQPHLSNVITAKPAYVMTSYTPATCQASTSAISIVSWEKKSPWHFCIIQITSSSPSPPNTLSLTTPYHDELREGIFVPHGREYRYLYSSLNSHVVSSRAYAWDWEEWDCDRYPGFGTGDMARRTPKGKICCRTALYIMILTGYRQRLQ